MKQALYGIAGGLVAGLLFLTIMFLGPLSGNSSAQPTQTATATSSPQATLTQAPTTESASISEEIALCSVKEAETAEGILQLQAQVVDSSTSAILFDRSGSVASRTASVLKLVTAAAALETLGPDYTVTTRVYVDVADPSILYLVGAGDVTLSRTGVNEQSVYKNAPKITTLVKQIKQALPGQTFSQIVLDTSLYGAANGDWKTDWDTKGIKEGYMSRVSALQFDGDRDNPAGKDSARGNDPVARAGKWFKQALGELAANAKVSVGITAPDADEVAKVNSRPIKEWIDYMLVVSDNTLAEALARLVALDAGYGGSFASLDVAYKKALAKTGLNFSGLKIEDGSGLSDYNAASPAFINGVLSLVDRGYNDFEVILGGMPVAGTPGSLSYRMESAAGKITAKTGWIQSGYTLAGFMDTPDGAHLIFTIYNLGQVSTANRDALDDLALAIYNCGASLSND
jgi:D-alanyl-D-alanine carboxypeptidase/D-alanyl-D-alanine-endopeptidase (penicillin-binding protein 4)